MFVEFFWHLGASFQYRRCQLRVTIKQTQDNFQHLQGVFLPKGTHESSEQQDKIITVWGGIKASHIPKNQGKKVNFSPNSASTCHISAKPPLPSCARDILTYAQLNSAKWEHISISLEWLSRISPCAQKHFQTSIPAAAWCFLNTWVWKKVKATVQKITAPQLTW